MNLKFDVLIRDNAEFDIESLCKQDDYSCPTLKGRIDEEGELKNVDTGETFPICEE